MLESKTVLLQREMNRRLMVVFSSAKMRHQWVKMKLWTVLIYAHALTLIVAEPHTFL